MSARDYFLGKRIAVIGLGPHGEMLTDIKFLVKANALVSVYDLRSEARLVEHMATIQALGLANFIAGSVPADDLLDMDIIILSHEYPRDSLFLAAARKNGIDIEYPETLFLKLAPPVMVVAVMGACGKATVVSMLAPMLEAAHKAGTGGEACFVADPESGDGILALLKQLSNGDAVIMRVDEAIQPEISALKWSPQVAIFTTVPPIVAYKESPFEIIAHQTYNNHVIAKDSVIDAIRTSGLPIKAKLLRTKPSLVADGWMPKMRAPHERDNAALALQAARIFKVSDEVAQSVFATWKPLRGRLEPVKKVRNVEFWNDTASVMPLSTVSGMSALSENKDLVVIIGGADGGADYRGFYGAVSEYAHTVIVLPGSGTLKERQMIRSLEDVEVVSVPSIEEAVRSAMDHARKGDKVLFSPAFAARGIDDSRAARGEHFVRAVRAL